MYRETHLPCCCRSDLLPDIRLFTPHFHLQSDRFPLVPLWIAHVVWCDDAGEAADSRSAPETVNKESVVWTKPAACRLVRNSAGDLMLVNELQQTQCSFSNYLSCSCFKQLIGLVMFSNVRGRTAASLSQMGRGFIRCDEHVDFKLTKEPFRRTRFSGCWRRMILLLCK